MTTVRPVTHELAAFASALQWSMLPERTRHAARRTFANAVGLAVGASRHVAVETALRTLSGLGLAGRTPVLGRGEELAVAWAPFLTGIAMHVEDFDDTHLRTVLHPGAPIVPAALAVGHLRGATGREILTAIVAGMEIASRVGNGLSPGHFDRGWHVTGTMGHLGAAAAAGRLLRLPPDRMHHALALAATQAAGHTEQLGSMTKSLHPGKAAADGVESALLAERRFTGPAAAIEGRRGLAALMAPSADFDEIVAGLGMEWETEKNAFKPYSCGIVSHPVIDAAVELRGRGVDPAAVRSVQLSVRPVVLDVMGVQEPATGLQSKFSVYHCFAVGLIDGAAGPEQYGDARAVAPDVVALRRTVTVATDAAMPKDACAVRLDMADGTSHEVRVEHATGSLDRPMTDEQLRRKFDLVVRPVLGDDAARLWDLAFAADQLESLADLYTVARG